MNNPNGFPSSAQFYTSSPRPFAKTSLGFYSEVPPYDNITDDEDEEMTSGTSATQSTSSTPPTFDAESTAPTVLNSNATNYQQFNAHNNTTMPFQQQQMPVPPQFAPTNFIPMSPIPPQFGASLDQHTLQQLMANPELLRQLNEASARLLSGQPPAQMPPPPPMFPLHQAFVNGNNNNNSNNNHFQATNNSMPPPPPFFLPGAFLTPIQTPSTTPVCGAPLNRPVINGVFSTQPLALVNHQRAPLPNVVSVTSTAPKTFLPSCSFQPTQPQSNAGLLAIATPPHSNFGSAELPSSPEEQAKLICRVCGDTKAGTHYGQLTCFACMDFFRRRVVNAVTRPGRNDRRFMECYYQTRRCVITKETRNQCKFCRFQRCLDIGMKVDAVRQALDNRRCQSALPPMM